MSEKDVLIIGAGISGITVALELAQLGLSPTLIEREASIGGLSASFCCKASESCNKCFACVVDKRISEVRQRRDISILTQTELIGRQGRSRGLSSLPEEKEGAASNERFPPSSLPPGSILTMPLKKRNMDTAGIRT